jgi:hypothetical protein
MKYTTNGDFTMNFQDKWTCPYLGYPIFASTAAREILQSAQARQSLEDCRIMIWMDLQTVFDEVGFKSGQFRTSTPGNQGHMVIQINTTLRRIECSLEREGEPPRLENVSLGGSVTVPTWEEEVNPSILH